MPSLADVISEVLEERARTRDSAGEVLSRTPIAIGPRAGFPVIGCLTRLVFFVLMLIAMAVVALFLLFGGVVY